MPSRLPKLTSFVSSHFGCSWPRISANAWCPSKIQGVPGCGQSWQRLRARPQHGARSSASSVRHAAIPPCPAPRAANLLHCWRRPTCLSTFLNAMGPLNMPVGESRNLLMGENLTQLLRPSTRTTMAQAVVQASSCPPPAWPTGTIRSQPPTQPSEALLTHAGETPVSSQASQISEHEPPIPSDNLKINWKRVYVQSRRKMVAKAVSAKG